ncbi:hypothetical protein [Sulfurovum sp.]|uniref:hypothetical protein n=1 Tax=Sulfurovum sp. TaxID=1969726 RepID=UPI0035678318
MNALKELSKIEGDINKWKWLMENQEAGLIVNLDNDDTFVTDPDSEDDFCVDFDGYVGWSDGVISLLEAIGIKAEPV